MSAITYPQRHSPRLSPWLFVVLAVVLAMPPLVMSAHASLHQEADLIRQCSADPANILQVWLNSSGDRLNCLIQTPEGVGNRVIQWSCRQLRWLEVNAYFFGGRELGEMTRILREKACQRVY